MPGKHSRTKGAAGEREASISLRLHWHAKDCIRAAQAHGKHSADLLHAVPMSHVEVKRYAHIKALGWLRRAEQEAPDGALPLLLLREDMDTDWSVLLRVADAVGFSERLATNLGHAIHPMGPR